MPPKAATPKTATASKAKAGSTASPSTKAKAAPSPASSDAKGKRKRTDDDASKAPTPTKTSKVAAAPAPKGKAAAASPAGAGKKEKKAPAKKRQDEPRALNVAKTEARMAAKADKAGKGKKTEAVVSEELKEPQEEQEVDEEAEKEGEAARQKARKAVVSAQSDDESDDDAEEEEEEEDAGADSSDEEDDDKEAGKTFDTVRLPSSKDDKAVKARLEAVKKSRKAKGAETATPGVLYFGRLPSGLNEFSLRPYLSQFGDVTRIRMARNKRTGAFKHYGFVEFADAQVAQIVQETMNNYLVENRLLQVRVLPKEEVHPALWIGANRTYRKVPVGRAHRVKHNAPKTAEKADKASQKLLARQEARKEKLKASGIEYDFKGYA